MKKKNDVEEEEEAVFSEIDGDQTPLLFIFFYDMCTLMGILILSFLLLDFLFCLCGTYGFFVSVCNQIGAGDFDNLCFVLSFDPRYCNLIECIHCSFASISTVVILCFSLILV